MITLPRTGFSTEFGRRVSDCVEDDELVDIPGFGGADDDDVLIGQPCRSALALRPDLIPLDEGPANASAIDQDVLSILRVDQEVLAGDIQHVTRLLEVKLVVGRTARPLKRTRGAVRARFRAALAPHAKRKGPDPQCIPSYGRPGLRRERLQEDGPRHRSLLLHLFGRAAEEISLPWGPRPAVRSRAGDRRSPRGCSAGRRLRPKPSIPA